MKVINLEQTVYGCPTVFEWINEKGENIYFRLRHGYARIENETKGEIIICGDFEYGDGICSWKEVVKWAKNKGLKLKLNNYGHK